MQHLPQEVLHCLQASQVFPICLLPLPEASIPVAVWERWVMGTKLPTLPPPPPGIYGGELG